MAHLNAVKKTLKNVEGKICYFSLAELEKQGFSRISRLPFSLKILLESLLQNFDNYLITEEDIKNLAGWDPKKPSEKEFAFLPGRVLMQDFTGIPAILDLAAMREAFGKLGGDPKKINPLIPVDLVVDHSIQVDRFGSREALQFNTVKEFERNRERYEFLKWGQKSFKNFRVVPPATGIVHQVNLEHLGTVITLKEINGEKIAFPDTLVGTDSHTTMINGLGIVGWGVGGIEAEAVLLGQPMYMLAPKVVGCKLTGELREGVTATDLVLTLTKILRSHGVVDKFVEFYGNGLKHLSLADRATIANMAPEYGATIGYFPIDNETLNYLKNTGRGQNLDLIENYAKEQGIFFDKNTPEPIFSETLELDLNAVESSLAGPKRPQDLVPLKKVKENFRTALEAPLEKQGYNLKKEDLEKKNPLENTKETLKHGSIVIASLTSCTNTSNPAVMIAAGILAKKALEKGLKIPSYIKTSLAPGSKVVKRYLQDSGLLKSLENLGFNIVAFGCTTCIGNSGPLPENISKAITEGNLIVASILSGNRNFEGRVHPLTKANYLASPPLVIGYALAGTMDIDLLNEPLGISKEGKPVYLRELWPTSAEIRKIIEKTVKSRLFEEEYGDVFSGSEEWNLISAEGSELYPWDEKSTYILEPPYFEQFAETLPPLSDIKNARALVFAGDSVTTDHISPAGSIAKNSPAGTFLLEKGVKPEDFNAYGTRRANHEIMMRGTFANNQFRNLLTPDIQGTSTRHFPDDEKMSIYDASMKYRAQNVSVIILAGKDYGMGSSRDWAAKGPALLGVKAVIFESVERIHRANLIGMGILPLQFEKAENPHTLGLKGDEEYSIEGIADDLHPRKKIVVTAKKIDGSEIRFSVTIRLDTAVEIEYFRNGGILQTVLRQILKKEQKNPQHKSLRTHSKSEMPKMYSTS